MRRLRVLISAFAFSRIGGSEPAVGWNFAKRISYYHDVTVICGDLTKDGGSSLEHCRYLANNGGIPNLQVCYVAPSRFVVLLEWLARIPVLERIFIWSAYSMWQRAAFRVALDLHSEKPFDLIHQLNYIGFREPGYLWKLPVPFVWGPIGGGSMDPWCFLELFSWRARFTAAGRNIINAFQQRLASRPRQAAHKASKIWAATPVEYAMVREMWGRDAELMSETGTDEELGAEAPLCRDADEPLRIVWSGLHNAAKALPIVLHAISLLQDRSKLQLTITGDGPETDTWKKLANVLGIAEQLEWTGWLTCHSDVLLHLKKAHVLAFSSLREGTPHAVLEAISIGVPVICHDICGMGVAINDTCGIKIALRDPQSSILGFRDAIAKFINEPNLVQDLSGGALRRARELTWERKAAYFAKAYCQVGPAKGSGTSL